MTYGGRLKRGGRLNIKKSSDKANGIRLDTAKALGIKFFLPEFERSNFRR